MSVTEEPSRELDPLTDTIGRLLRRLVDRGKATLGKAAAHGRDHLRLLQVRRDLDHFWVRLGKTAYHLVEAGEVDHPALRKAIERIDDLERRIDELSQNG